MSDRPHARLLDITRLVSRIGRGPLTGVDRVERAYLETLGGRGDPLHFLLRTRLGYLWLPRTAGGVILGWIDKPPCLPDALRSARSAARPAGSGTAHSALRKMAADRSLRRGLAAMVRRQMPDGGAYLNVGHSNLTEGTLSQIRAAGARIAVLVHDTIPLDLPQFGGAGAATRFGALLRAVSRHADLVICNSSVTAGDVTRWLAAFGRVPDLLTAHLGTAPAPPDPGALPADMRGGHPYFVCVGTIEPRKNHALLLDAWENLSRTMGAAEIPDLWIAGARGWNNADVFARLDRLAAAGGPVHEVSGLSDGGVSALVAGARALLMPSKAEGFGWPVAEAAALGTPVICSDLPVYRETVGDYPVYAPPGDLYRWVRSITDLAGRLTAGRHRTPCHVPTWTDHFNAVLART